MARNLLIVGAIGLLAAPAAAALGRWLMRKKEFASDDARIDQSLRDTFPASDPPASHFVDIPANRQ